MPDETIVEGTDDPTPETTPAAPKPKPVVAKAPAPAPVAATPETPPEKKGGKVADDDDEDGESITLSSKALKARMSRVSEKERADLMKQHGLTSWDEIAQLRKAKDDLEKLQMTESERIQREREELTNLAKAAEDRAKAVEQTATQAQAEAAEAKRQRILDRVEYQIGLAASREHAEEPQDVIDLLRRDFRVEFEAVADEEGKIDAEKVKALVEKAKTARPKWFSVPRSGVGSPSNAIGRPVDPTGTADIRKRALRNNSRIVRG